MAAKSKRAGQLIERGKNVFQIRIFLGRDGDGKRKYFSKTLHCTKKLAEQELNKQLHRRDTGQLLISAPTFLKSHIEKWLKKSSAGVREATAAGYKWVTDTYITPTLGMQRLSDLQANPSIIQRVYDDMLTKGLSPRTIRYTHSVLSASLKDAVDSGILFRNPCKLCTLPLKNAPEMNYFTAAEVKIFLKAAEADRYFPLFLLAIETGMRPGEYLGLKWSDIDFANNQLSVRRSVKKRVGGGFYFTEPKTKKSRRAIPLSGTLLTALKEHRRVQAEYIMKHRKHYQDNGLVFPNEIGEPFLMENLRRRHFAAIVEAYNAKEENEVKLPKIRLYDLRHTMATLLLTAGVHPKVVSERLGHASITLTMDTYSHVLPTMQQDATESLERLMAG